MSGRVLLVDDSPIVLLTLARAVRAVGLEPVERDSVAAVVDAPTGELACALLDLELPDGDGVAIATHLRARTPGLPIAFFSGGASADVLARARDIGRVFGKPSELDGAVAWIRASVERE